MRYTIMGYNQQRAVELGLDVEDLLLIDWIKGLVMSNRRKSIVKDGKALFWVNYSTLLEDLPILGITKGMLRLRLKKMEDAGILIHHTDRNGGVFSYYGFGDNAESLVSTRKTLPKKLSKDTEKINEALAEKISEQRTTYNNKTIAEMMASL